jgi:hypothetical protein
MQLLKKIFISVLGISTLLVSSAFGADSTNPDRVFIKDLEGIWMDKTYLAALRETKSPLAAGKKAAPFVIAIRKEGKVHPYFATDFKNATLMVVFDVEPDKKEHSYRIVLGKNNQPTSAEEVVYVWFKGKRAGDGQFRALEIKEPLVRKGKWAHYERIGRDLGPSLNSIVITGKYRDQNGKTWEFGDKGMIKTPSENPSYFELSLIGESGSCDYIEVEDLKSKTGLRYYGFGWAKDGVLNLYKAKLKGEKVICDKDPFTRLKKTS